MINEHGSADAAAGPLVGHGRRPTLEFEKMFATEIAEIPDDRARRSTLDALAMVDRLAGWDELRTSGRTVERGHRRAGPRHHRAAPGPPHLMPPRRSEPGELLTLTEVAERLGVHYMTAYRYLRTGRLDGTKHGTEWRVRPRRRGPFEAAGLPTGAAGPAPTSRRRTRRDRPAGPAPARAPARIDWAGRAEERHARRRRGRRVVGDRERHGARAWRLEEVYLDLLDPGAAVDRRPVGDRRAHGRPTSTWPRPSRCA